MATEKNIKLAFHVETERVLRILSAEIYDSPLALLRENLQNAYDAILMRMQIEGKTFLPEIRLEVHGKIIIVTDNGIGMDLQTLSNNFWKAGSSGKRGNKTAEQAGVIGTFGIGAMANFGVCKSLEVTTTSVDKQFTYHSKAIRENLKIGEECIDTASLPYNNKVGTTIEAILDDNIEIDMRDCIDYIVPYIEYLPIPVLINGQNYSQKDMFIEYEENLKTSKNLFPKQKVSFGGFKYELDGFVLSNSFVYVKVSNLYFNNKPEPGSLYLFQGATNIMCYRNYFGLSSTILSKYYNFGGRANLSFLSPTAGREALSRESIGILNSLLDSIEQQVTPLLAEFAISNYNTSFQKYITITKQMDLGKNLTINVKPENIDISLESIPIHNQEKTKCYYIGQKNDIDKFFANENNDLYLPAYSNPRRQIQLHFLKKYQVKEQTDEIVILKIYDNNELDLPEKTILVKIQNVIQDDYIVKDMIVQFAEISIGVTSKLEKDGEYMKLMIAKSSKWIVQLKHIYKVDFAVLMGFVKDYVREELYPKFADFVPSATKGGAEVLHQMLLKTRELFKIGVDEKADIDAVLKEYEYERAKRSEMTKMMKEATGHTQVVKINQISSIEKSIPDLIHELPSQSRSWFDEESVYNPMPPLLREEQDVGNIKLLHTDSSVSQLNSFKLFIALGDRLYKMDKDFFYQPHTTKIIWGNHKIIYIFGHVSNKITLYYDIQLKEKIDDIPIGGAHFMTTTIITKDKIFIPIPRVLEKAFYLDQVQNSKEYYIKFDLITDIN